MHSKFVPADFDSTAPLALIAGKGRYPILLAENARKAGIKIKLIAFNDETDTGFIDTFDKSDRVVINVGQLGKLLKAAKNFGARYAIMAGQITPKKLFRGMMPDLKALAILATLKERNAQTIFGAIASELSKVGTELIDARSFMDEHIAPEGFLSGSSWKITADALEHGLKIARECARLDIGQGCVVSRGSVIAVEAWEGTDKMLARAGEFPAKDMLFVKTVKRNQDYRFDVPVIGERTLRSLDAANIRNVAVEAGKTIILDLPEVKSQADRLGIKIFGI